MKILCVIPAYNEEANIAITLNSLKKYINRIGALVVNDGSEDRTSEQARKCNAIVIDHPFNMGGGIAVQTGFKYAYYNNYDFVFQFDADGQHNENDIEMLLKPLIEDRADFCIGSRYSDEGYEGSGVRKAGTSVFSAITSILIGQKLTDVTSGFKAMNRKAMKICVEEYSADFPDVDTILSIKYNNLRITEIPTQMKQRLHGTSYFNLRRLLYYPVRMSYIIMIIVLRKIFG